LTKTSAKLLAILFSLRYDFLDFDNTKQLSQDVRAWLIAALTAERITTTVIRGGHLGAAHDVQRE